ncbi:MAG TPA: Mor transcription activator family protein [Gammaproteobacteria bacterium]|nr:Mor transcription activator family protein [Gammaproteobacteria bacterium]
MAKSDGLPESILTIADLIGLEAATELVKAFGGIRVYVPVNPAGHSLADVIGADALRCLSEVYGGDRIEVPRAHKETRDALIRERYHAEESMAALAREFWLTERTVRRIVAE